MRRVKTSLTTTLLLSCLGGSAIAQESEPEPDAYPVCDGQSADTAAAKGAFQAGTAAFNEADYDRAITYWEDAYRRDCTAHALLKNLARAYELNSLYKHAIFALRTYSQRSPVSSETESLERRIANLEAKLEEMTKTAPPPPTEQETKGAREPAEAAGQVPGEFDEPVPTNTDDGRSPLPLVFAGAGLVTASIGGVLWLGAKSDESDASGQCVSKGDTLECSEEIAAKGQAAQRDLNTYGIVTGVGAAVILGGIVWYFSQSSTSESARLAPQIAPGFAGLSYSGAF